MSGVKISQMETAATLTGAESIEVVQGGENVKSTTAAIANLATSIPAGTIIADVTYTVAPTGADFTEPGAATEYLAVRRIAPGVMVTVDIASGTYVCTKAIIGHVDGYRIRWTNDGRNLPANTIAATGNGATATVTFNATYVFPVGSQIVISGVEPTGFNGTYTVTASSAGSASFASTETGPQTDVGTVEMGWGHLDSIWVWDTNAIPPEGITPASRLIAKAVAETMARAKYKVILEFPSLADGGNSAVTIDNLHSGDWTTCPCLFINTGVMSFGLTTGSVTGYGSGAGGVGIFTYSAVFGFSANLTAHYGGVINFDNGLALFAEAANMRSDFHGGFRALDCFIIGGKDYGFRANHGGYIFASGAYVHGQSVGCSADNSPSMFFVHGGDIQFNFYGLYTQWGGTGKAYNATVKNNCIVQIFAVSGFVDARNTHMESTATFEGTETAAFGVRTAYGGTIDISSPIDPVLPGVHTIISGHRIQNVYLDGTGLVFTSAPTDYGGFAVSRNDEIIPDDVGYLKPFTGKHVINQISATPQTFAVTTDVHVVNKNQIAPTALNLAAELNLAGRQITVVDFKGNATANPITITPADGKLINGAATYVIDEDRGAVTMVYNDVLGWIVIARYSP